MKLDNASMRARRSNDWRTFVTVCVVVCALLSTVALARFIDSRRQTPDPQVDEEDLYVPGPTLRRASLDFNGLAADWYWMRSLQYVGHKFLNAKSTIRLDDLSALNLRLLVSLLDTTTTLDPEFMEPYQYAAVILPTINVQEAIRITKKGIAANPSAWPLYQHLGYIYWQQHDYHAASEAYGEGGLLPGAPPWMEAMKAKMAAEGGSHTVAREIYSRMYEQATESSVKEMARQHLLQLDSREHMDALRKVLFVYQSKVGRCPSSWRELTPVLRNLRWQVDAAGAPVDPTGKPYVLVVASCEIQLDPKSEIPRR